tara:strand:- start:587 stop:688 length:102 start_codon:yes stop_codon:yes gene_type:complete
MKLANAGFHLALLDSRQEKGGNHFKGVLNPTKI